MYLANDAQNEWRYSTDAHRYCSKLWRLDPEMPHAAPRKKLGGITLAAQGAHGLCNGCCKTDAECYFCFMPFIVKAKIHFKCLSVS